MIVLSIIAAGTIAGITVTLLMAPASESSVTHAEEKSGPVIHDSRLAVELVAEGLKSPTSMRFLDESNILVLQKNDGQVRLVSEGELQKEPVMRADVVNDAERGLLGVAIWNGGNDTSVFLYMTEKDDKTRNRVYKYSYDWDEKTLANRTMILDLPGEPGPYHNGGKIAIGYDGYLYAVIGDVGSGGSKLDNQIPGREPNDKSVVLRVNRDTGMAAEDNPFYHYGGDMEKLKGYYAYGIRNSFGLDFDPVSHSLWITEDGPDKYDEINMVKPGFNGGWHKVTGPIARTNMTAEDDLVIFDGARYEDPAFSWYIPVGVTDIEFFSSTKLGEKYANNIFVGDVNNGNLYFFEVNESRTGLQLHDPRLLDMVADPAKDNGELSSIILGEGFGRITDIETGPDGCLYILTYEDGRIYRIVES
jgi:glucose/arabinose dehydrogenase